MTKGKYILIYNKVKQSLEEEGLFLDPGLSLKMLSKVIGTNTVYLSRAINEGYGCSFTAMVNRYRVEYLVKRALRTKESIEDINAKCGFWSRSTFYDVFRELKGMTPKRYIESMKEKTGGRGLMTQAPRHRNL